MKKWTLGLLLILLLIILFCCKECSKVDSSCFNCDTINTAEVDCESIKICQDEGEVNNVNEYDCTSLIVLYDDLSDDPCKREERLCDTQIAIEKFLKANANKLPFARDTTSNRIIGEGTFRSCDCGIDLFLYENEALEDFNINTVTAGTTPAGGSGEGHFPNFIFRTEGNLPTQMQNLAAAVPNCIFNSAPYDSLGGMKSIPPQMISENSKDRATPASEITQEGDRPLNNTENVNDYTGFDEQSFYDPYFSNVSLPTEEACYLALESLSDKRKKITIAIVDSGLDFGFMPEGVVYNDPYSSACSLNDPNGWSFINGTNNVDDSLGHGTLCALSYLNGLEHLDFDNHNQRILPVKVMDTCGFGTLFDITCGIYYAKEKGADVINLSIGAYLDSCRLLEDAIDTLNKYNIVAVTSAGNDSLELGGFAYKHYPSVLNSITQANDMGIYEVAGYCTNPEELGDYQDGIWAGSNFRKDSSFLESGIHYQLLLKDFAIIDTMNSCDGTSFAAPAFGAGIVSLMYNSSNGYVDREKGRVPVVFTYLNNGRLIYVTENNTNSQTQIRAFSLHESL